MKRNVDISPVILIAALTSSVPLYAATPVALQGTSLKQLQQTFHMTSPGRSRALATAVDSLQLVGQHTDEKKVAHVRLQQEYAGFPVFGGYAITHAPTAKRSLQAVSSTQVSGMVYADLVKELGRPNPLFIQRADLALQQFKAHYSAQPVSEEQVTPMVYVDEQHRAFWAYQVSVLVQKHDGIPERPTAIIDANTSHIFLEWNDVKTNRLAVKGQGYGGNTRIGSYQFGIDFPFLELSRDDVTGLCYMQNNDVSVIDMEHGYSLLNNAMAFACMEDPVADNKMYWTGYQGDGYDLMNGAYSPTNDALYIGSVIKNMYSTWYGVNVLMGKSKPMKLVMRVHYGEGYENAFWDGQQMTFGDGGSMMYPLVSLSVGAHEISHGFTEQHADLNYVGQSGGMNESFSDMAAQAAEFYSAGKSSWEIGGEIMKESSGYKALRYLDRPSRDGWSIDRANQYRKGMDVHYSSGVYNRLFYLLAHLPEWDVRKAFQVMVKANMDYWTPYSTFEQGACGVLSAATDLGFSVEGVKQALDDVVISYQQCA